MARGACIFYMKTGYILMILAGVLLAACSHTVSRRDRERLDNLISRAELFFETGEIDSSLYYLDLCFDIDRDYPPAHHLKGRIYLYKDGIYNRKLSASELRAAVKLESDNAEYHYSLGLTLDKQGYYYNALHEFEQAAERDSTDPRPLSKIAEINERIGLRYDDRGRFERAVKAASAAASLSNDPTHYYKQAVALYQMDEFESSSGILLKALKAGTDSSVTIDCLLLLGANLVETGNYDSAYVVFEEARKGMSQDRRDIMDDVRYLMPSMEYARYRDESFYKQERMLTQFWGRLDPDPTTGINERKLEHYARFIHAQLTFSLPDRSVDGWRTKRGEMYIRYGRPSTMDYVLGSSGNGADAPKWIWKYNDFSQPVTLVFEDTFLNGDFDFPFPNKSWTAADFDNDPARIADMLQDVIPQTFAYSPGSGPLEYFYMPRQFKASRGKTSLEIFVAVPYDHLEFRRQGNSALATLEWRQVLRYGSWRISDSAEVVRSYEIRASQVDNPNLSIADRLSLEGYPDSLAFSISIRDTLSNHMGIDSRDLRLRDFYTGQVEISDIVLARRIDTPPGEMKFERGDLRILSNLDNRYFTGEPVWLYFEIYNLAKGPDDRTSYTIKQRVTQKRTGGLLASIKGALSGKDLQEVETSYSGGSIYTEENRILMVRLSDLEPGPYTISIEVVDDVSGISTSGSEDIVLYK
jgi:GWxTD domain-containing protein